MYCSIINNIYGTHKYLFDPLYKLRENVLCEREAYFLTCENNYKKFVIHFAVLSYQRW